MRLFAAAAAAALIFAGAAEARTWRIRPGPEAEQQLQTALIEAEPGDTVQLGRGRFELTAGLSLDVDRVTIRGEGEDRSILSFDGQRRGAEGLLITSDGVSLRGFAVENARGDAIKARDCNGIHIREVRVEWTRGPNPENGAYGLYPVNCSNVLIERSIARGASDAGIYVGQSRNIIVRDNTAEFNVAGIEIENSYNADVFGNTATRNTGGILVFDLPGLPQKGGHSVRVFENRIVNNDTPNFAPAGNIVASVPTGTGVLIMANRNVHVFENEIADNGTVNVLITAYRNEYDDREYVPVARDIVIRDNSFGNTGFAPAGDLAGLAQMGVPMPDVLWDGSYMYTVVHMPTVATPRIVVRDNTSTRSGQGSFLSLGLAVAGTPLTEAAPDPTPPPLLDVAEPEAVRIRD
ncbi:MAG TPA: parallel beta-helix domain-containing protein [Vitreimonas sp.]|uniref:parallel beta-helix domain-containing protein n=1 Tax=Vitreimonas sp. TaxID=3069702 RepID=UPI002D2AEE9D|nr:parallel beta-helix domain-containing protein [Vitreimonas sp.]HYD89045.1 parallel beta-helix domain-containing protein [Vitreimonas sp.]